MGVRALALLALLCVPSAVTAQPDPAPRFGVEFELRAKGTRITSWEDQRFENFERILRDVVRAVGGDPRGITKRTWVVDGPGGQPRTLMAAEYTDPRGRKWTVEPEYVDTRAPDGYELVTPPLSDPQEIERVVRAVQNSGAEGIKSSVHVHVDGRSLVRGGNATGLINLINLHETYEPQLRRLFEPVRGAGVYNHDARVGVEGAYLNRFNRPLYHDHPELLRELAQLSESERTPEKLEALFRARTEAEARAHGIETLDAKAWKTMWKYRSLNLVNALGINDVLPNRSGTVEFRMNDLRLENPEAHMRQVEFYRALVQHAAELARQGKVVPAPQHRPVPAGENPAEFLTAQDPTQAREDVRNMLREVGLDPERFEQLIRRNVRAPPLLSEPAFRRAMAEVALEGVSVSVEGRAAGGEAGLRAALERLRQPGARPVPVELLVRVPRAGMDAAWATAQRLAEGANAARLIARAGHDGVRRPLNRTPAVQVERARGAVKVTIDPTGVSTAEVAELVRMLSDGIRTAGLTGRAGLRGDPLPAMNGTLAERAVAYAELVEGRALPAEIREALRTIEARGGQDVLLPLLSWARAKLSRAVIRDLRFRQEVFLREAISAAERMGETGEAKAVERVRDAVRAWARETQLARQLHRGLAPTGFERAVAEASLPVDRLAEYRRADGTLDWKKLTRSTALREAGGVAHFALALFLKELAVVAKTGDRARVEEFFEGLATTDFYVHYGLFVLGARAGEVAYARYLERFVKPRFVNGILKTNLVLATGLALPELVGGTFSGKAFAISLASLGLSTTAVRTGVAGIKWVVDLKRARQAGTLAKVASASRLARMGGWLYSVAELAVILFVADEIDHAINSTLELRAARQALADAGRTFFAAAGDPNATPESVREAAEAYHAAWGDYRNYLYSPLQRDEALFAARMEKVARQAKLKDDERRAALDRLARYPRLRANIERRHGSLEAYADWMVSRDEADVAEQVETYARSYEAARNKHLAEVYDDNQRDGALLADVDDLRWLLRGAREGASGDPAGTRSDIFAGWTRDRARGSLDDALRSASTNRLQAYDDEAEILAAVMRSLPEDLAAVVGDVRDLTLRTRDVDDRLAHGDGLAALGGANNGAIEALEQQ